MRYEGRYTPNLEYLVHRLEEFFEEIEKVDSEIEKVLKEIRSLEPERGTLVYKWVLNKVGKKYWYWYLHINTSQGLKSIYIGKYVPQGLIKKLEDKRKLRYLQQRLRDLRRERKSIIERYINVMRINLKMV